MMLHLVAQNSAGRNVVAVAEAARHAQDLKLGRLPRIVEQPIDMDPLGPRAGQLEGMRRLEVAVSARGAEN